MNSPDPSSQLHVLEIIGKIDRIGMILLQHRNQEVEEGYAPIEEQTTINQRNVSFFRDNSSTNLFVLDFVSEILFKLWSLNP